MTRGEAHQYSIIPLASRRWFCIDWLATHVQFLSFVQLWSSIERLIEFKNVQIKEDAMKGMKTFAVFALVFLLSASLIQPVAAKSEKESGRVAGHFSPGGTVLTVTSESQFDELWGLVIDFCDGSHEENFERFPSKIEYRPHLGSTGYSFYAEKPMRRVVIKTLPIDASGTPPTDFILTTVQRKCGNPEPTPNLYCNNVQVAHVIHRSVSEPIEFHSNRHVVRAGLKFPGVNGLAPARDSSTYVLRPSLRFDPVDRVWTGTFISVYVPVGDYKKVELVVQDDFGEQAKCPVGDMTVLP